MLKQCGRILVVKCYVPPTSLLPRACRLQGVPLRSASLPQAKGATRAMKRKQEPSSWLLNFKCSSPHTLAGYALPREAEHDCWRSATWAQVPTRPRASRAALGKALHFLVPWFPHLQNGNRSCIHLTGSF